MNFQSIEGSTATETQYDGLLAPASQPTETPSSWRLYLNQLISAEISTISRYSDVTIQVFPREADDGLLLSLVDCPLLSHISNMEHLPDFRSSRMGRPLILLNGNLNHALDFQETLTMHKARLSRSSRVAIIVYNSYFRWLYLLANRFGLRRGEAPTTFVTTSDIETLARLSGYELVRMRQVAYFPWKLGFVGPLLNSFLQLIPGLRSLSLAALAVLRPIVPETSLPSLSIVIPARNEKGNIENALKRMPDFGGAQIEVIFVEGNSTDDTWEEIQRVLPLYADKFKVSAYKQPGKGKADAVRLGFAKARHDLVTILDADLTMPPELLERFYDAYTRGLGDFVNGNRLLYPMEGEAMKFLNKLGNVFFAKALSSVLGTRLGDSLCGTKLLTRRDYERMCRWREDFGDFDPFGDFELLFPAAELALGIVDIPIRYRDRVYGTTNIRRFYHGFILLRMTLIGLLRVKLGKRPKKTQPS